MRSRDGNSTLSLRLCSIIIFSSLTLSASEYFISYNYIIKDLVLYNETLLVSHAMKKCEGEASKSFTLENNGTKELKEFISKNPEEFIDYIHELGLHVKTAQTTANLKNSSTTIMTLKTTCFKVDFNDNLVTIAPLK